MFGESFVRCSVRVAGFAVVVLLVVGLQNSSEAAVVYRTTYRSVGGQLITAIVEIDGTNGTYQSYNQFGKPVGNGQLSDVSFTSFGGKPALTGKWRWFSGSNGSFFWVFDSSFATFSGSWTGPGSGSWSGNLSGGSGQLGANGPLVGTP